MMQMNASAVTKLTLFPNKLLVNTLQYLYFRSIILNIIKHSMVLLTQTNVSKPVYEELKEKVKYLQERIL